MTPRSVETCVGAVVIDAGRLLLIQRGRGPGKGYWSIPGGRVEPGETLIEAVEREVLEETGLKVQCGAFIGWVERIAEAHHFVILDFAATVVVNDEPIAADDAAAVTWVDDDQLHSTPLVPGLLEFLTSHRLLPLR